MRITRQKRIEKSDELDKLAHEAGIVYSTALVTFKRVLRKKNHWLTIYSMQRLIRNAKLHSQSVQGIVEKLYQNIESWRQLRKSNPKARLPKKRRWYFAVPYKKSAIRIRDGKLILSNGKGNEPLVTEWAYGLPKYVEISYDDGYIVNAVYNETAAEPIAEGDTAGIDLGEIHIAAASTAGKTIIANGRELRSKRRYLNKETGKLQARIDKCKKGSKNRKRLSKAKTKMRNRLNNQIKDILHKQTTKLICALKKENVKTVAIGDVRNIRRDNDKGHMQNQKIHGMATGKARFMLTYKSEKHGMAATLINEAYSSQTCPRCTKRTKTKTRNYRCKFCGFEGHRDGVGSINIRQKQMYQEYVPVVGDMAPPVGMRYHA
ncbi:MAG: transposase [Oscillospiraceae bacterium]|nr:transposase [Oscillospiraceae bacterium]